jgi:hypothetical protein
MQKPLLRFVTNYLRLRQFMCINVFVACYHVTLCDLCWSRLVTMETMVNNDDLVGLRQPLLTQRRGGGGGSPASRAEKSRGDPNVRQCSSERICKTYVLNRLKPNGNGMHHVL